MKTVLHSIVWCAESSRWFRSKRHMVLAQSDLSSQQNSRALPLAPATVIFVLQTFGILSLLVVWFPQQNSSFEKRWTRYSICGKGWWIGEGRCSCNVIFIWTFIMILSFQKASQLDTKRTLLKSFVLYQTYMKLKIEQSIEQHRLKWSLVWFVFSTSAPHHHPRNDFTRWRVIRIRGPANRRAGPWSESPGYVMNTVKTRIWEPKF